MATKTLTTPLLPNQVNIGTLQTPNILTTPTATTPIAPITPAPSNQPTITPGIIGTQPNVPPAPVTDTTHQNNLAVTNNQNIQNAQTHVDNVNTQQTGTTTAPVSTSKTIADQLMNLIGIQGTQGQFTSNLQDQNDIAGKTKALNTANNDILTKSRAYDEQIKAIRDNPNGRTRDAVEGDVAALNQKKNDDIANLGIIAQTAQGNLNAANSIIDTKVKSKFEPINNQISSLEKAYNLYQNDMSESEKLAATEKINEKKTQSENLATAYSSVLKNASAQGAPASVLAAIDAASSAPGATQASIYAAAGKYGIDQSAIDDHDYKMAQINSLRASAAKKSGSGKGGSSGSLSTVAQAIIDNPNLINSVTPTVKGQIIAELQGHGYDISSLGGKPLSDTAIAAITQDKDALYQLTQLKDVVANNEQYLGPVKGLSALNPFSPAKKVQAQINLVRQKVGKALEGGVLRKEDEEKYKEILATMNDTPNLSQAKIDNLIDTIQTSLGNYTELQTGAGKSGNLTTSLTKKGATAATDPLGLGI